MKGEGIGGDLECDPILEEEICVGDTVTITTLRKAVTGEVERITERFIALKIPTSKEIIMRHTIIQVTLHKTREEKEKKKQNHKKKGGT